MSHAPFLRYYIRVTNPKILEALIDAVPSEHRKNIETSRSATILELRTHDKQLWSDLYLYGQMLAQAQDENIDAGQD